MTAFGGLGGKWARALMDIGPVPTSGPAFARAVGGTREATRALTGRDRPPQRAEYADPGEYRAAVRRYRSTARNAQRYARGERNPARLTAEQRGRVENAMRGRRLAELRRNGAMGRVALTIRARDRTPPGGGAAVLTRLRTRQRVMPATGSPGQYVDADTVEAALVITQEQGADAGALFFVEALLEAYLDFPPSEHPGMEFSAVEWLKIWPEGTPEPS